MELDKALYDTRGMNIRRFALQHGVTERTIRRDLEDFRELGKQWRRWQPYIGDGEQEWYLSYWANDDPLFLTSMPTQTRILSRCRVCLLYHCHGHKEPEKDKAGR